MIHWRRVILFPFDYIKLYLLNIMVQLTLTLVVTLCCFLAISECLIKDKEKYQSDEEERFPYTIWIDNRKMIERHNSDKNSTFKMEMNQFGDMVLFLKWSAAFLLYLWDNYRTLLITVLFIRTDRKGDSFLISVSLTQL
ncbi:unnamed protein product [Porites lobata]|uniref:Cathepsin propeptide inhibitor domain-containing protein n=1 Tax=Porites lobata TaxID=104759 RepID=A0ABN8P4K8_9CNID|nr:unnamed protein product [Porites lobata]